MQGLLFPYLCAASHSGFSHYWGFQNHSCSNSWLPTWFLQLSLGWHFRFKSDSPSACPEYSCSGGRTKQKPRFCHITPVLSDLHWLPVRHRISFKIATVTFRVLQFQQPSYLASLIPRYVPTRALRSSSSLSICVPPRKTTMAASKSFSSVASCIWNALPNHLSSIPTLPAFRRALKHHLFLLAYPDSSAKSGTVKPAQCITLRDTVPTTAIAQPGNTMLFHLSAYD